MDIRALVTSADAWKAQIEKIKIKFDSSIEEIRLPGIYPTDVPIIYVKGNALTELLMFLKTDQILDYQFLSDLTATDEEVQPRFEVVYNLFSHSTKLRIRVKCRVSEGQEVRTATAIWPGANWAEREVWDMFGIRFAGHPSLRRLLMDERWEGHPLRKDYPLRGYQFFQTSQEVDTKNLE